MAIRTMDFQSLYERHGREVWRFALYLCGDPAMADDITSETFVRAWIARKRLREPTMRSYLFTVARNICSNLRRQASRRQETELRDSIPDERASQHVRLELESEVRAVLAALQELHEEDRSALLMRALEGMPYEEIAAALGISVIAAKVKVHRARRRLMQVRDLPHMAATVKEVEKR
jgi:RNA polymerase sigma-70 factor, ECF subfamily